MAWTQDDLTAIETAIAKGEKSVSYGDRTVVYRDIADLLKVRDVIREALARDGISQPTGRRYASFSSGL